MKMVKCLLLGSAAGMMSVGGAFAADLPVKAKPVEYVKVCSLYGAGFWYVPGTDTCIKLGGYIRAQIDYNAGNGGQPTGQGSFSDTQGGLFNRTDNSQGTVRYRGVMSVDLRTQTEYGTLRSYMDLGTQQTGVARFGGAQSGLSVLGSPGTAPANVGPTGANTVIASTANNYFNEAVDVSRAFIQFAGLTAGRIRSFFDINSLGPYSLANARVGNDTAAGGLFGIAYTFQFGNGLSLSIAGEDGGTLISGRGYYVNNMNLSANGGGSSAIWGVVGGGVSGDNHVAFPLDPVIALRIDQAWGYAGISAALHNDSGGYYGTSEIGGNGTGTNAGHPADAWGWAVTSGFTLTNVLGFRGDTFGVQGSYCIGAEGYCSHSQSSSVIVGGNKLTAVWNQDGVYTNGSSIELTTNWGVYGFYEHLWNSKWRTSLWGGVMGAEYDSTARGMICPANAGGNASFTNWAQLAFTAGSTCNPNYSTWEIGSRTMWNPHPDLDIGLEVLYTQLNQSNTGSAVMTSAQGAQAPTIMNFANQGVWTGMFRVQRNFLY